MEEMFADPDPTKVQLAFAALLTMKKLDIAELRRAFAG